MALNIRKLKTHELHERFVADCESTGLSRDQLATLLGVRKTTLDKMMEWSDLRHRPGIHPYPDRIARLHELRNGPVEESYLYALAKDSNYFLVPMPARGDTAPAEVAAEIEAHGRAVAEVIRLFADKDRARRMARVPHAVRALEHACEQLMGLKERLLDDARRIERGPATLKEAERLHA